MDPEGYPDEDDLRRVREWPLDAPCALMEFLRSRWRYADCGFWTQEGDTFSISTGGWSGNESLLSALEQNLPFWGMCWVSSRRGGHYVFTVPAVLKKEAGG